MKWNEYNKSIPKRYDHIRDAIVCVRLREQDKYKTAISCDEPYLYKVVTRVSAITAQLWLDYRNELVKNDKPDMRRYKPKDEPPKRFPVLPNQVNWFIVLGKYRREQDELIKAMVSH